MAAVVLRTGAVFTVRAAILCTGTYLTGRTIVGECIESSGPDGMHAANALTASLLALGLPLRRFKTGTPPRVNRRSIDFSKMEIQEGDARPPALQLHHGPAAGEPRRVLPDLHQRRDAPHHPRESGPQPHLLRRHRGHRPPLLPVHRDEDRPLCGQAPPPAVHRAHGAGHRGDVHPGVLLLHAGGGAASDAPQCGRTGARGDDAPRLRHRVRLHRSTGPAAHAGGQDRLRSVRRGTVQRLLRL